MLIPINVRSDPGIKRDGTKFEGSAYVDGQWVRFQRGLPRKIGGYRSISNNANGIVRQFYTQALNNFIYTHIGTESGVQSFTIDTYGNTSAMTDRTPAVFDPYTSGYNWNFDAMFDGAGSDTVIFANPVNTLADISDGTSLPIYFGSIYASTPLQQLFDTTSGLPILTSGNICVLHPYLFVLDKNGYVRWSDINDPQNFSTGDAGDAYITSSKLVKALPLRGGGQSPAGLIWALDSLIRVTYTGGTDVFSFDTVSASTSILSANSVIEYDGLYFWVGIDRFMVYNGVVQEVPNNMNINYFFDGLNQEMGNKVFAMKVTRYGEIWWCYPRGDATECTHAIIYNVREKTWYDCELPNGGRSAGIYAQVFHSPIMAGVEQIPTGSSVRITEASDDRITEAEATRITNDGYPQYKIWRHEYGANEIDGFNVNAVQSWFETGDISLLIADQPKNRSLRIEMIEPDFVQTGDMQVQIMGRINARAPEVNGPIHTFPDVPNEVYEQQVFFKEQRRELRFRFESNTVDGDFQMGQIIAHIEPADGRYQS